MNNIIIRSANKQNDLEQLIHVYNTAFSPENMTELTKAFYHKMPWLPKENWLVAEDELENKIVAAVVLIPWQWNMEGTKLKVAEMGIVATLPEYRGKGLMYRLNEAFNKMVKEQGYDFSGIQGIPGFYYKFGYEYSVAMENHINMPYNLIDDEQDDQGFKIRLANENDIPFLMEQDQIFSKKFPLSVVKSKERWHYILNDGKQTEYNAAVYVMEKGDKLYFFKILLAGFGQGLILSEASENMPIEAMQTMFVFLKSEGIKQGKPFIRINMHKESSAAQYVINRGVSAGRSYAWQIKIHDELHLLCKMQKVFENRVAKSIYHNFSGVFRIDFYTHAIDFTWENGTLLSIDKAGSKECINAFYVNMRVFALLCFGHRSWEEIRDIHCDVFPYALNTDPVKTQKVSIAGNMLSVLFPKLNGWINLQY